MGRLDRALLAFLTLDGLIVGLLSVAFAYQRFGGIALPVAALFAGIANAVLLWLAAGFTVSAWRFAPLAAWGLMLLLGGFPGPGGDVVLTPAGPYLLQTVLLLVLGAGPVLALVWSGRLPAPDSDSRGG